jgi:hypothetical protein
MVEPVFEMLEEAVEEENFPWECYEDDDDDDSTSNEGSSSVKDTAIRCLFIFICLFQFV